MNIDNEISNIGFIAMGCCATFFVMMYSPFTNDELFVEFLTTFGLTYVFLWWYPIYKKENDKA